MVLRNTIIFLVLFCGSISVANQWHDEADRCWNEAQKYKNERNYKQAIEYLKRAVIAERKNENPHGDELIAQLNELGKIYDILGSYEKSLHYYKLMLSACRKANNADQEVMASNSIGLSYFNLNRFDEAMNSYRQALDISKKNGYKDKTVLVLNNMASAHRVMKNFHNALSCYEEALSYAADTSSTVNRAVIISNAGTMYFFTGDFEKSLDLYSQALDIDNRRGGDEFLSVDLSNIGGVYAAKGKYGEALNYFEKALEIDSKYKNEKKMSARLYRIGDIYFRVGDNNKAIECYNKSLEINLRLSNTINAAQIQNSIGQVYDSMGKHEEALDCYLKALTMNKDIELKENIALRLSDIGLLYETRERYGEAVDFMGKALLRDMLSEKKNKIAYNLSNIGRVMVSLKRYDKALDYFRQAINIYRELGDIISVSDDSKNCGIVYYNMKEYGRAIEFFVQGLQTLETAKEKNSIQYAEVKNDTYRWLVASYVKADRPDKACEMNEAFCINRVYSVISETALTQQLQSISYEKMRNRLDRKTGLVMFANIIWDNPYVIYVDADGAVGCELDKAATVNNIYNMLGKDIEGFIGKKKTDIIFKVAQKSRRDYYYIEFEKIINYYRSLISKKYISGKEYDIQQTISKALYQMLFSKIERNITGKDTLIIQPDGVLSTVPFETMVMPDGRFLIEKYGIRYIFSQTCSDFFSSRLYNKSGKMLVLGDIIAPPNPVLKNIESSRHFDLIAEGIDKKIISGKSILEMLGFFGIDDLTALKGTRPEITALRTVDADAEFISGDQVSEASIEKLSKNGSLGSCRIAHVISRGIIIPEVPQMSSVMVSFKKGDGEGRDGILHAKKITGLVMRPELLHIASITMPVAGYTRGEGVWILCGSFMIAGVRGVSMSLWNVDEVTRSFFMKQVYQAALKTGISYEQAFTKTKRAFIKGTLEEKGPVPAAAEGDGALKFSNPYFWGSFIYYGP